MQEMNLEEQADYLLRLRERVQKREREVQMAILEKLFKDQTWDDNDVIRYLKGKVPSQLTLDEILVYIADMMRATNART